MEFGFVGLGFEAKPNEPKNHRKSILPASTRLDPPESTAFLGFDHQRINYVRPDIFFSVKPLLFLISVDLLWFFL